MEEPKRPDPRKIEPKIGLEFEAWRLRDRADLCVAIVAVLGVWNEIQVVLNLISAKASGADPAIIAWMLEPVVATATKRKIIKRGIDLRFGEEMKSRFWKATCRLDDASGLRNEIAHGLWFVHDDLPRSLIRVDGITDLLQTQEEWGLAELEQAHRFLFAQLLALKGFWIELRACPEPSPSEVARDRAWHLLQSPGRTLVVPPNQETRSTPQVPRGRTKRKRAPQGSADPGSEDPRGD